MNHRTARLNRGFSLVEIAIVLVILGTLMSAAVVPLSTLQRSRHEGRLAQDLVLARDALIAHLVSHGALPCPVGRAAPSADAPCAATHGGLSAVILGMPGPVDARGALLDPWGRAYRYAVSAPDWTTPDAPADIGIAQLRGDLSVCTVAVAPCPREALRANDLVFVVLSTGADATGAGLQSLNLRGERTFTLALPSRVAASRFDDGVVWASRSELVWWLLRAARLP